MPIYVTRGRDRQRPSGTSLPTPRIACPPSVNVVEAAGGKLLSFYVTLGHYDFLIITEAPSAKEASAAILAAAASGSITDNETTEAFTTAEAKQVFAGAGKVAEKYKRPGQ